MRVSTSAFSKAALIFSALTIAAPATAAVSYTLAGSFQADTDQDMIDEVYAWTFSFSRPTFVTTLEEVTPDSCTITGTFYQCAATQTIDPTGSTFGPPIDDAFVGFNVQNTDQSGGGTAFYFFEGGAFSAFGVYSNAGQPSPSGNVGNAGPATLIVANAVPEPASWAMMVGGFGLIGSSMRRRANTRALCA
jgi:hypothetical protein